MHQWPATIEFILEQMRIEPEAVAHVLHNSPTRCGFTTHDLGNAE
jgi:urease accessory protein UreE